MPSRTRTKTVPSSETWFRNARGNISSGTVDVPPLKETCVDIIQPGHHHPFSVTRDEYVHGGMFYKGGTTANPIVLTNYRPTWYDSWRANHLPIPDSPSDGAVATQFLARTTPNRPKLDLLAFAGELKDVPQLLRVRGERMLQKTKYVEYGSRLNLLYQFGWKPFVSDLIKLSDFQGAFAKKAAQINSLYDGNGLFYRIDMFQGSAASSGVRVQTNTNLIITDHHESYTTVENIAVYGSWKPTTRAPETNQEFRALVRKVALGLYVNPHTVWQLMPWSWLIDWCVNASDFLMLTRNAIPCVPSNVRVMRTKETELRANCTRKPTLAKVTPTFMKRTTKTRSVPAVGLTASMPFLSGRQASILASIGALRAIGRGG